jgi:hypothetical protein
MRAASIGIEAPLHVGLALDAIERRAAAHFLVGGGVAAALRVRQRGYAALFHEVRNIPGCRSGAEIEEQLVGGHKSAGPAIISLYVRFAQPLSTPPVRRGWTRVAFVDPCQEIS